MFVVGIGDKIFFTLLFLTSLSLVALFLSSRKRAMRDTEDVDGGGVGRRRLRVDNSGEDGLCSMHTGAGVQETIPPLHDQAAIPTGPTHAAVLLVDPQADCDRAGRVLGTVPTVFHETDLEAFEQELEAAFESYAAGKGTLRAIEQVVDRFDPHNAVRQKAGAETGVMSLASSQSPAGLAEAVEWTRLWLADRQRVARDINGRRQEEQLCSSRRDST